MATKSKKKPAAKKPVAKKKAVASQKPAKKNKMKMKASKPAAKPVAAVAKPAKPKVTAQSFSSSMLTPLDDRVVVRIADAEEKTAGGLFIPTSAASQPDRGEVMAKGPGRRNKKGRVRPLDVEVGDTVLFPQHTGTRITIGSEEFLIMHEEDVLGVVET